MRSQLSKNTLFNFFSGQATPLQKKLIEQWLEDKTNTEQYYEWMEEWERDHPQFLADTEQRLQYFLLRLENKNSNGPAILQHSPRRSTRPGRNTGLCLTIHHSRKLHFRSKKGSA